MLAVGVYFGLRGVEERGPAPALRHARDLVAFEQRLGLRWEDAVQQAVVGHGGATPWNWVYIWGHWPVIAVTLLMLWHRAPTLYRRLRRAMVLSGLLGLVVFATYPVAPPRLADLGLIDTVSRQSHAYRVLQPPAFVNQYAAMPSLHVGWDLLVGLTVIAATRRWWLRALGAAMPVLMGVAVLATANHYVVDVVAGVGFGLLGFTVSRGVERRQVRRAAPSPRAVASPALAPVAHAPVTHAPVAVVPGAVVPVEPGAIPSPRSGVEVRPPSGCR